MNKKNNRITSAGTDADSDKMPIVTTSATILPNPMCVSSEAAFVMRAGLSMGEAEQPSPSNRLHAA